ncbi:hypothetical protein D3C81_1931610 [compost metagenome]
MSPDAPRFSPLRCFPCTLRQLQGLCCFGQLFIVEFGHREPGVRHDPGFQLADGAFEVGDGDVMFSLIGFGLDGGLGQVVSQRLNLQLEVCFLKVLCGVKPLSK